LIFSLNYEICANYAEGIKYDHKYPEFKFTHYSNPTEQKGPPASMLLVVVAL